MLKYKCTGGECFNFRLLCCYEICCVRFLNQAIDRFMENITVSNGECFDFWWLVVMLFVVYVFTNPAIKDL